MKDISHTFLRLALEIISGTRTNQRLVIFGVRRSGNHALTNWLTNAIEASDSELIPIDNTPPLSHCFKSPSGKVVHLNELNELDFRSTWKLFKQVRKWTKKCQVLILSFEDIRPSEYNNFRRLNGQEVWISRKPLEIISSRFHNINQKAQKGIGWSRQSCDAYFFDTLRELIDHPQQSALNWDYNDWLTNPSWRQQFLENVRLSHDIMPKHSAVGGGSSFHGTSGKVESDLPERLKKVEPANQWHVFLTYVLNEHKDLLSDSELKEAKDFLASPR